jgi:hypothetical protein
MSDIGGTDEAQEPLANSLSQLPLGRGESIGTSPQEAAPGTGENNSPGESVILGQETSAQARAAVADILRDNPGLADLVSQTTIEEPPQKLRHIWSCPRCHEGRLHGMGQNRLRSGKAVYGGLLLCDRCGHYERRR